MKRKNVVHPDGSVDLYTDALVPDGSGGYVERRIKLDWDRDIDLKIHDVVRMMNLLGYDTINSCQGHFFFRRWGGFSWWYPASIIFQCESADLDLLMKHLPDTWKLGPSASERYIQASWKGRRYPWKVADWDSFRDMLQRIRDEKEGHA